MNIVIKVKPTKKLFLSDDGYGIYAFVPQEVNSSIELNSYGNFSAKGYVNTELILGFPYTLTLKEEGEHHQYGKQYTIQAIGSDLNLEKDKDIVLKGIFSDAIYEKISNVENIIDLLTSENYSELVKIKGIGQSTAENMVDKFRSLKDNSKLLAFGKEHNISAVMINKIIKCFPNQDVAIEKITSNPYRLIDLVDGIGFAKADEIALKIGISATSTMRYKYKILDILNEKNSIGISYMLLKNLLAELVDYFTNDFDNTIVLNTITQMKASDELRKHIASSIKNTNEVDSINLSDLKNVILLENHKDGKIIALAENLFLAINIKKELTRINEAESELKKTDEDDGYISEKLTEIEKAQGYEFNAEQREGIINGLKNNIFIISGFAGTGKTTTLNGILKFYNLSGLRVAQTALSGRASSRMAEATGYAGSTIHRLLGSNSIEFAFNKLNPLNKDLILLDEASMVNKKLFYSLIQAIPDGAKLGILGDVGQLESIGTGNIFSDLITSGTFATKLLTSIHRQSQKSAIKTIANETRQGISPVGGDFIGCKTFGELQDLTVDIDVNGDTTVDRTLAHVRNELKRINSISELQVLTPLNDRGVTNCFILNNEIQKIYNPLPKNHKEVKLKEGKSFIIKEGDKVINLKNDYNSVNVANITTPIFNGSVGIVISIEKSLMIIDFEGIGEIKVTNAYNLRLAYAIGVYKAQGSEYDRVIFAFDNNSYKLLSKELLYTGISRAKENCIVVAQAQALDIGCSRSAVSNKKTFLKNIL